ncbi:MAG: hypothetical protein ABIR94_06310 [Rubrivivax sp.]
MPTRIELEEAIKRVEQRLEALGQALQDRGAERLEHEALALRRALGASIDRLGQAARAGEVPPALRQRLALATGQVAAQRESLARATAALDRAIDVLMPSHAPRVAYSASGLAERSPRAVACQA